MKDIAVGIIIVLCCVVIGDFIYTEKHTCTVALPNYTTEERKCGILKSTFDIEIDFLDRLW